MLENLTQKRIKISPNPSLQKRGIFRRDIKAFETIEK